MTTAPQALDEQRLEFLRDLDKSDVTVTPWEVDFLDGILSGDRTILTEGQRKVVDGLIEKYDRNQAVMTCWIKGKPDSVTKGKERR